MRRASWIRDIGPDSYSIPSQTGSRSAIGELVTPSHLPRRPFRLASAAFITLLAGVLAAGPVAADTDFGHKGQVGPHSLRDTYSDGGAKCVYEVTFEDQGARWVRLAKVAVYPPRIRAISAKQKVGWRFIVLRSQDQGPWGATYRSPIQKATAYSDAKAKFSPMGIKVIVPPPSTQFSNRHLYRVVVKMFWFRADGSQQGSAKHLVDFYREKDNGEVSPSSEDGACRGINGQVV